MYYKNGLAYAAGEYREWAREEFPAEIMAEIARLNARLSDEE